MQQFVYDLYVKYSNEPIERRISLARIAYRKTEEHLRKFYDSWNAFNGILCLTLMCLSGDGNLTQRDYDLFRQVSDTTPTYDELYDMATSLNYQLIIDKYRVGGQELLAQALILCATMFACKGSYGRDEQALVDALSKFYA